MLIQIGMNHIFKDFIGCKKISVNELSRGLIGLKTVKEI